ncbi:hypothetical protein BLD25_02160 [Candidatus Gracilibacteria bacterium GN02-872]|nr:hypothetical protein BLD25_02160 [Candidatus Gracilibacteria bacterium GN02-872]RKW25104.1 MAG: hypothetical protein D8B46_00245 [Candidatus Gracilibacteria bacterium]
MKRRKNNLAKFQRFISEFLKNIKFDILNLNMSRGTTVIGAITGIISLFLPWIVDTKRNISWNAFYPIAGNAGFMIIIGLLIIIFLTFGANYKEKMKLYSDIDVKNYLVILFTGFFMFLASIMGVSFSVGLETFGQDTTSGTGLILCIASAVIIIGGGYWARKDFYKNSSEIILEQLNQERHKEKGKDNITLPF